MSAPGHAPNRRVRLWTRWIFANAVGEAAGLGLTALAGVAFISHIGNDASILVILALAALTILAGTLIEGTLVGTA